MIRHKVAFGFTDVVIGALVLGLFVAGGLVFVFAGTLARSTDLEAQAQKARAEVAALEARVEAGLAEVEFVKTDAFIDQQARAIGYGTPGETRFRLPPDAPPPAFITPLGSEGEGVVTTAPFEAWMELLFGA